MKNTMASKASWQVQNLYFIISGRGSPQVDYVDAPRTAAVGYHWLIYVRDATTQQTIVHITTN